MIVATMLSHDEATNAHTDDVWKDITPIANAIVRGKRAVFGPPVHAGGFSHRSASARSDSRNCCLYFGVTCEVGVINEMKTKLVNWFKKYSIFSSLGRKLTIPRRGKFTTTACK